MNILSKLSITNRKIHRSKNNVIKKYNYFNKVDQI